MTIPNIVVVTYTGLIPINLIEAWVASAQIALTRDFAPHWSDAKLRFAPPGTAVKSDEWILGIFDHTTQAGALGFHDVTDAGLPLAKVFVQDCLDDSENWNTTCSHELHEMIVDPNIDQTVIFDGFEYAKETDDACEDDQFAVRIAGHMQSNSVTPAWFDPAGVAPYTVYPCAEITKPFQLATGGYIGRRPIGGAWTQLMADKPGPRQIKRRTSRTLRRFAAGLAAPARALYMLGHG
jgi:hypothetical protein